LKKAGVGLSHSNDENCRNTEGAKGLGYSAIFKINNPEKAGEDFLWNYK
jgi:hypothetical protein